ncbi:hypothetical protein LEP1GSC125_0323 [Leptospira mayottensis 200901122]|uniref:Uncharacterized protein n=1 Tax=Leptospira mayottensis 200901122 TaxID=1193010 RepID=A0AA87MMY5_9LEPT|nr:hypothetical protein LEP1GSC125_0323 [Leptospira mayottensis 200901122]
MNLIISSNPVYEEENLNFKTERKRRGIKEKLNVQNEIGVCF